ncbi:MAG: hypothetical protein JW731_07240 [Bacteroidales bacterium]|nr:hypothetical protein [Bacteroidales bacterium]
MNKLACILLFTILVKFSAGQTGFSNPYFPSEPKGPGEWKLQLSGYASQESNSNSLDNQFFNTINRSGFIEKDVIETQIDHISDKALSGQISNLGAGIFINSAKKPGKIYYYAGFDHDHYLDTYIDKDLVQLLLLGNKPFAGQTLEMPATKYYNIYFNQVKGGVGFGFGNDDARHDLLVKVGINSGQNYDYVELNNSSVYTHPEGDFLDITANVINQASDTVWATVFDINGMGVSTDISYSFLKKENFYLNFSTRNLGLIFWNGNTFSGEIDTTFRFEGLSNDSLNSQNLPGDYSYNSLRRLLFKNPDNATFSEILPWSLNLSVGKFLGGRKFYIGFSGNFYPTLQANYLMEIFATWNIQEKVYLTPLVKFGSYGKLNFGMAAGVRFADRFRIELGSAYLNSMLDEHGLLGNGGFIRLVYTH